MQRRESELPAFTESTPASDTQIACKAEIGAEYALNKTWTLRSALEFVSIGGRDDMDYVRNAGMNELYLQIPVRVAARRRWERITTPR